MIDENDMIRKYFLQINWKEIMNDAKQLSEMPLTPLFKHMDGLLNEGMEQYATGNKRELKKALFSLKKTICKIEESL